jgi:hypothetical protein
MCGKVSLHILQDCSLKRNVFAAFAQTPSHFKLFCSGCKKITKAKICLRSLPKACSETNVPEPPAETWKMSHR